MARILAGNLSNTSEDDMVQNRLDQAKTISATEAKNRLGGLIGDVAEGETDIIIENHGRPRAVLISFESYREMLEAQERQRRMDAMDALRRLRDQVRARNEDLDEKAADAIAEEISQEAISRIIGRIRQRQEERLG
jgi:prevent-host-death family protein